jgi:hypothetical protein
MSTSIQTLTEPSITQPVKIMQVQVAKTPGWAEEVVQYIKEGKFSKDKKKSRQEQMRSALYTLIGNTLY